MPQRAPVPYPDEARCLVEASRIDFNIERPHTALGGPAPMAYAQQAGKQRSGSPELREGSALRALSLCLQPEGKTDSPY